jgi:5-methylcytosine-specific restriction endonuclease McrA
MHAINLQEALRKQRERERINAWKKANRASVNATQRAYRAADPERGRKYDRQAYGRDPEKHKAKNAGWVERNPERKCQLRRESAARHAPENRARAKAWQKANPETVKAHKAAYRARQRSQDRLIETFTHAEIAERDHWTCHLCGGEVTREDWSIDHLVPLSFGGDHTRLNVKIAHTVCNARRGNRDLSYLAAA